ncbi:MAG: CxxxxCH/CxxCH domain-containing protein [Nitrospirae bacterium]|nr:CxxxxCH/CxxCH domain-containing protein [Nitrospirota bacterium]
MSYKISSKLTAVCALISFLLISYSITKAAIGVGDGNLLRRSQEETCHACHKTDQNAPNDNSSIKTHSSEWAGSCDNTSFIRKSACISAGKVWTQKWTGWGDNTTAKYGKIVCTTCHTAHDTSNIYLIKENITSPKVGDNFPGSAVDFRVLTGVAGTTLGTMGDDNITHTTSTRVCEVCHTQTKYHNYNRASNIDNSHNNATNCATCHQHSRGFAAGGACNSCHGSSGSTGAPLIAGDLVTGGNATGSTNYGKHQKHAADLNIACDVCHGAYVMPENTTHAIDIGFSGNAVIGAVVPYYNGQTTVTNYTYRSNSATTGKDGSMNCTGIYCHSNAQGANGSGTPSSFGTPSFSSASAAMTCASCHKDMKTDATPTGSHKKHANASTGYNMSCSVCHTGYTDNSTNASTHVDKSINVAINATYGGTYAGTSTLGDGYSTCSSVYCHSNGTNFVTPGTPNIAPTWGNTLVCNGCHGDNSSTSGMPNYTSGSPKANSHYVHVVTRSMGCQNCHADTTTSGTAIDNKTAHTNKAYNINPTGTYNSQAVTFVKNGVTSPVSCNTISCHGGHAAASVTWGVSPSCNNCHGASNNGDLSGNHAKHYNSATPATSHTGADNHTGSGYVFGCVNCHPSATHISGPVSNNIQDAEVNGTKQTSVNYTAVPASTATDAKGFHYTPGTCSNVCHTKDGVTLGSAITATPAWNGTNALGCGYCHSKAGDGSPTWSSSHTPHMSQANVTCNYCHKATADNNTTVSNRSNHPNQNVTINFNASAASNAAATYKGNTAGGATVYQTTAGTFGTCATTTCHGASSPTWGTATSNDTCTKCHGTGTVTVNAANKYVIAPPRNLAGDNGTATGTGQVSNDAKVGAHQTHLRLLNGLRLDNETIEQRCEYCHGTLPVSGMHANGSSTPAFQGLATKNGAMSASYASSTCSNTYCHNPAGTGGTLASGNAGTGIAPRWDNASYIADGTLKTEANCNVCHKSPGTVAGTITIAGTDHASVAIGDNCAGCHGHNGDTAGSVGQRHMDGIKYGAGSCNSCHWFDNATDATAWTTTKGSSGLLTNTASAWGAHNKHINHLKTRYGVSWTKDNVTYGSGSYNLVCGVCHTQTGSEHMVGARNINFNDSTAHQFGLSKPIFDNVTTRTCSNLDCHFKASPVW